MHITCMQSSESYQMFPTTLKFSGRCLDLQTFTQLQNVAAENSVDWKQVKKSVKEAIHAKKRCIQCLVAK